MPPRSQLPGSIPRVKLEAALSRLGFRISHKGGDGSHSIAICEKNQKVVTLQKDIRRDVLYYLLKEIEAVSGITWDQIREKM